MKTMYFYLLEKTIIIGASSLHSTCGFFTRQLYLGTSHDFSILFLVEQCSSETADLGRYIFFRFHVYTLGKPKVSRQPGISSAYSKANFLTYL